MIEEDDNGDEDDEVEANNLETKEVVLEDDWTYSRYGDIIFYIYLGIFLCKRYEKIDIFLFSEQWMWFYEFLKLMKLHLVYFVYYYYICYVTFLI